MYVVLLTFIVAVAVPVCCIVATPPQIWSSANDARTHPIPSDHCVPPASLNDKIGSPTSVGASQQPAALHELCAAPGGGEGGYSSGRGTAGGGGEGSGGGGDGGLFESRSPQSAQSVPNAQ